MIAGKRAADLIECFENLNKRKKVNQNSWPRFMTHILWLIHHGSCTRTVIEKWGPQQKFIFFKFFSIVISTKNRTLNIRRSILKLRRSFLGTTFQNFEIICFSNQQFLEQFQNSQKKSWMYRLIRKLLISRSLFSIFFYFKIYRHLEVTSRGVRLFLRQSLKGNNYWLIIKIIGKLVCFSFS